MFAAILFIGVAWNVINLLNYQGIDHDESYTIIRSAGQGAAYHNMVEYGRPPVMTETRNAEWLAFLQIDGKTNIVTGLVNVSRNVLGDIHPPLADILIYLWAKLFGSSLLTLKLFSVFIYAISVAVFCLAVKELFEYKLSLVALLVFSIAYGHLEVTREVRSYALFGLWNLLAFYSAIKIVEFRPANNGPWWMLFAIVSVCGFYTHYLFLLVFLPIFLSLLAAMLKDKKNSHQTVLFLKSSTFIAVALIPLAASFWVHRDATMSITRQWLEYPPGPAVLNWEYIGSLSGMLKGTIFSLPYIFNLAVAIAITSACIYGILRENPTRARNLILTLFLANSLGYILLYVLKVLPPHAIGPKYQVALFPYYLLGIFYLFKSFKSDYLFRGSVIALISFIVFGNTISYIKARNRVDQVISMSTVQKRIPKVDLLILDTVVEGLAGPVISSFPEDQVVLIGPQKDLSANAKVAEIVSKKESVAYFNALKYYNKDERRDKIIDQIQAGLGYIRPSENIAPYLELSCRGCGKGYRVFVFER